MSASSIHQLIESCGFCRASEVEELQTMKTGMTNRSYAFFVKGNRGYLKSDVGFFCFRVFEKGGCSKVLCGVFSFRAVRGKAVAVKFFVGFRRRM